MVIAVLLLLITSFIVFVGVRISVDPTSDLQLSRDKTAQEREIKRLGLDRPLTTQYLDWLTSALQGDLGRGDRDGELVTTKLSRSFSKTFELIIWAVIFSLCLGITFGVVSAINRNNPIDYAISGLSYLGIAIPVFAFAYVLINLFGNVLPSAFGSDSPWLYSSASTQGSFGRDAQGFWSIESVVDYIRHMALPITVVSIQLIASWSRYQRATMIEALNSGYVRTAVAKGSSKTRAYFKHALKNTQVPMLTIIALDASFLFQGVIYTEFIFNIPGMGTMFLNALDAGDATTLVGWTVVTAAIVILVNLLVDLLVPLIDPRVRSR